MASGFRSLVFWGFRVSGLGCWGVVGFRVSCGRVGGICLARSLAFFVLLAYIYVYIYIYIFVYIYIYIKNTERYVCVYIHPYMLLLLLLRCTRLCEDVSVVCPIALDHLSFHSNRHQTP